MDQDQFSNNTPPINGVPSAEPTPPPTEQTNAITSTPEPAPASAATPAPDKTVGTTNDITKNLIGNYLGWYIIFGIIYSLVFRPLTSKIESMIVIALIAIVLHAVIIFLSWKMGTSFTFKSKSIRREDVQKVMKNMLIFVVAISVINGAYRFYEANSTFNKNIESNYGLKMKEMMLKRLGSDELIAEYNKQKEEAIAEAKKELYIYLAALEVGLLVVHLGALPLEKKFILKHVAEDGVDSVVA